MSSFASERANRKPPRVSISSDAVAAAAGSGLAVEGLAAD